MLDILQKTIDRVQAPYLELRYHAREVNVIRIRGGELEDSNSSMIRGTGVRALVDGAWGFSSTNKNRVDAVVQAARDAVRAASVAAGNRTKRVEGLADVKLATGRFECAVNGPLKDIPLEEKMRLVRETERSIRESEEMKSGVCVYREILDHKSIVTSDGGEVEILDSKPDFYAVAIAGEGSETVSAIESVGVTGGWDDLFRRRGPEEMAARAVERARKLVKAKHPKGRKATVILDPGIVGLIAHEALGHTVEADFVISGSAAKDKLGQKVASSLITLVDAGRTELDPHAGGTIYVDDECVKSEKTVIIEKGVLKSYLHDRETAHIFGCSPTGNARAFEYDDEPLIRMTNTYIEPGDWTVEEMIEELDHGYLMRGAGGGQADANAEFMFEVEEAYEVRNGEVGDLLKGVSLGGQAFDLLKSVDAVGKDFMFDMGSGYCGKFQSMKVDGGGPHLRCKAIVGGRREGAH